MVLAEHRRIQRFLKRRARVARPQRKCYLIGVFLGVVREILVVNVNGARRRRLAPRPHDREDVARVVAVRRGDGVFEVAVHAACLHHKPCAVFERLARAGCLVIINEYLRGGVVGAVVGGDGGRTGNHIAVLERQTHAIGVVQTIDGNRRLLGFAHTVQRVSAHLIGNLVVAKQHIGGNLHHEVP